MPCDVWWASPALAGPGLLALLDGDERRRHARYRIPADRDRYAVAHALARIVCADAAGCTPGDVAFTLRCPRCAAGAKARREPHGKPVPAGPAHGWEMSISHSGERVVVALAKGVPIGVDVELVRADRDIDGLLDYALTDAERADLATAGPEGRTAGFYTYWARKEALLKATGEGLAGGLTSVSVTGPTEPADVLAWDSPSAPPHVRLTDLAADGPYRAALAALTAEPLDVRVHDAAPLLTAAGR
ncbi:4-phosphopantetheinyl transferase [Marinitenerispora sediminis]|uniref:4-phosphopantetheinyl transferase n=1 Tax=Marinitenerispora sediminis TaxID=1931232 RepID=A0A368T2U3_9ACTN|nr:4-phosphopantetheinyl transferase [Marinitenerispora sediminis]RCV55533.1 4-phosphopantetheinyl transferase [Marinitenerispora sediminis]RCV57841.1 4-phosphopantetheinyl transferase [Marinitenerispora sediminis]